MYDNIREFLSGSQSDKLYVDICNGGLTLVHEYHMPQTMRSGKHSHRRWCSTPSSGQLELVLVVSYVCVSYSRRGTGQINSCIILLGLHRRTS